MQKITPFLWFDGRLAEAMDLYTSTFPGSTVVQTFDMNGELFTATFRVGDIEISGMNASGGPPFNEAISLSIDCVDQAEVDYYWDALLAGGGKEVQCGWLVDRFGISWQVVPRRMNELLQDPDPARAQRAMAEMMTQIKLDVAALERAADGIQA